MYKSTPYSQIRIIRQFLPLLPFGQRFQPINIMQAVRDNHPFLLWLERGREVIRSGRP
jgi:hypothetical protein